ncbi:MAG: glycosyltransferase family 4 protein [Vicinamibacterales bacterium]
MKLALVVQRYGADINGGAELHARYIAERLARHAEVEVLTTCARDYVTWKNELPTGADTVNGVSVRRFRVSRERSPRDFGRRSVQVFERRHSLADELAWLRSEGPTSPTLVRHLSRRAGDWDFVLFFSYRYYHTWHGARAVASKAILVPTAERDPAVALPLFGPVFRCVRGIMYNSFEERALIQAAASNPDVPGVVVGVGSDVPERPVPQRFRRKHDLRGPFAIYVGRIDENKGCPELFSHFERYARAFPDGLSLVLVGNALLPVPSHPRIKHLGFVSDEDKFDAMAAADLLVMPSYYESLSMVALEAWALGKPVLANGKCDVLRGQCIRSSAGLYYESYAEFAEALYALEASGPLNAILGSNGREYFRQHYAWPVIERKYLEMFGRLKQEDKAGAARRMEPLPGWLARRRQDVPPAEEILATLPSGPVEARGISEARGPRSEAQPTHETRGPRAEARPTHEARGTRPEGRRWHRSTRSSRR